MSTTKTVVTPSRSNSTKQKLSLFSFGSAEEQSSASSNLSQQSPSSLQTTPVLNANNSPKNSISLHNNDSSCIFERSVQDCCVFEPALRTNSIVSLTSLNNNNNNNNSSSTSYNSKDTPLFRRPRSSTHNSSISLTTGQYLKNEDYIPPALDATAKICNDKQTNLEDIQIYSNRRNSSVLALNAALGRPLTPISRKNSQISSHSEIDQSSENTKNNISTFNLDNNINKSIDSNVLSSPTSPQPPKLHHSKSSLSFYSYAEMINNEDYPQRRPPTLRSAHSQGVIPTVRWPKSKKPFHSRQSTPSTPVLTSNE